MWQKRRAPGSGPCAAACELAVEQAVREAGSGRDLALAANRWAQQALSEGRPGHEVEGRLDAWAAGAPTPLVRVGRRVHPASQLRFR